MLTRHEPGALPLIDMPIHLMLDGASGLLLAASPWLFGFADFVWIPHVVFGLLEIGTSLMTQTQPGYAGQTASGAS
jgi:hypothetical protein